MKKNTSKRKLRIENKRKKMAALLNITKLNEYDRVIANNKKNQMAKTHEADLNTNGNLSELEPNPKRLKTNIAQIGLDLQAETEIQPPPLIGDTGPSGKPKLSGVELSELKRMLRDKTKQIRGSPSFRLREMGENASLEVDMETRVPLFLSDLQHLLMFSQLGTHSPYSPSRWCALEKHTKLINTNILIVENVSLYHFTAHESMFSYLSENFEHKLEMITPSSYKSDIVQDLSMVPLTNTQVRKFVFDYGNLESAVIKCDEVFDTVKNFFPIESSTATTSTNNATLPRTDRFPRTKLLLSGWQMIEENFPLPIKGLAERKYVDYVLTKDKYRDVTVNSPMFAIDCEMCRTTLGDLELTRVSVVDEKHATFYDTLVKPDNKIMDYLTRYSGITPKMMKSVKTRLQDVHRELRELLPDDAILVGQSLSNDMHALKMMHPYIIDTSVIFNITGDRMRKTKLQTLSREFLQESIQEGNKGHCSTEDSLACMKLTQLKLKRNLYFGDAVMGGNYNEKRAYPEIGTPQFATNMLNQVTKSDKKATVVAVEDIVVKYKYYVQKGDENKKLKNISCIQSKSNNEVVQLMCEKMKESSLNIGHVKIADNHLEGNSSNLFKNIDKWVKKISEQTASPGLTMVVFSGQKDGGNGVCFIQLKKDLK